MLVLILQFNADRHHFDNPVYAFPGGNGPAGATTDDGARLPLNNVTQIHNDLKNYTNLERNKLGAAGGDDSEDDLSSKGKLSKNSKRNAC
jgi:hypothetical protein